MNGVHGPVKDCGGLRGRISETGALNDYCRLRVGSDRRDGTNRGGDHLAERDRYYHTGVFVYGSAGSGDCYVVVSRGCSGRDCDGHLRIAIPVIWHVDAGRVE